MSRAALKPQGRGAAPPVTSADCGLSRRGKHFPVNIVFPRETMPRKRPLILKLIVKVGARHTPTSPIRPANPTGFFFYFPALFQPLAPASVQQVSSSLPFARAGPTVVELCEGDRGSSSCEGAKKDARLHQSGGKKCFSHMDEVFEKINEKKHLETFI